MANCTAMQWSPQAYTGKQSSECLCVVHHVAFYLSYKLKLYMGACSASSQPSLQLICKSTTFTVAYRMSACRTLARTNHSCCNNASYHFKADGTVILRAVASITEGSEITISYVDLLESLKPRQCTLWERYAFHCTCARYVGSW